MSPDWDSLGDLRQVTSLGASFPSLSKDMALNRYSINTGLDLGLEGKGITELKSSGKLIGDNLNIEGKKEKNVVLLKTSMAEDGKLPSFKSVLSSK